MTTPAELDKFTWSAEMVVWDSDLPERGQSRADGKESRAWDEAAHPRAPAGAGGGGQFMSYDDSKKSGTGYGKKGGDADVRKLQEALNKLGFTDAKGKKLDVDGMLGPLTTAAILKAQKALGVKADGKVDSAMLKKIMSMKKPGGPQAQHDDKDNQKPKTGPQAHQDDKGKPKPKPKTGPQAHQDDKGKPKTPSHRPKAKVKVKTGPQAHQDDKGRPKTPSHRPKKKHKLKPGPHAQQDVKKVRPKPKPKPKKPEEKPPFNAGQTFTITPTAPRSGGPEQDPKVADTVGHRSGWDEASHPRGPGGKFIPGLSLHTAKGKRKGISHTTITAKIDGSKAGHVRLTGEGSEIDDLYVSPGARGKGVAHALMQEALDKFGDQTIRLHASPFGKGGLDPEKLQAFYAKHGFELEPDRGKGYMVRRPGKRGQSVSGEHRSGPIIWLEDEHPRGPGGKFASLDDALDELDDAIPSSPVKAKGPIKLKTKGKGKGKLVQPEQDDFDAPPSEFDLGPPPTMDDIELDEGDPIPPPVIHFTDDPGSDEPPAPIFELVDGNSDDPPGDLGEPPPKAPARPEPSADEVAARRRGVETTKRIGNAEGGKDSTNLPERYERDRIEKWEGNYTWWDDLTPGKQEAVRDLIDETSQKPTYVRMFPAGLNGMARDGRMKNVHEVGGKGDEYGKDRRDYEREVIGLDDQTPVGDLPIYGYVGDIETADAYGPIAVKLRPETRDRTTATVGDSLNGLTQPYGVNQLPDLTDDQLMSNIYGGVNVQNHLPNGSIFDYMEAQVHGGVSLHDIESVTVDLDLGERLDDIMSPETEQRLRDHGIEIIENKPDLLPGLTPEQIANLKGGGA